jgi:small subunit ribosomal protein S6
VEWIVKVREEEQILRKYEAIFIFQAGADNLTAGKEQVGKEFENSGIKVLEEEDMGERVLAYEIKKASRGHYIRYELEANPDQLQPIDKSLKLKTEILKFVFFRKDA